MYYYAYHGPNNLENFDFTGGYGLSLKSKRDKVPVGSLVFVIQKLESDPSFYLYGIFEVLGYYEDSRTKYKYRFRLKDISQLENPILIDEETVGSMLPIYSGGNQNWSNFKKHFCKQGASFENPLSEGVSRVLISLLAPSYELQTDGDNRHVSDLLSIVAGSSTSKEVLISARLGQGKFRKRVIDTWGNGESCALTGISTKQLLIASHIKPWSHCDSDEERLDGHNGILLASHIDKLFDSHLITFRKKRGEYVLVASKRLDRSTLQSLNLVEGMSLLSGHLGFDSEQKIDSYLERHEQVFTKLDV